jgi:anti-sigma factor RsiW
MKSDVLERLLMDRALGHLEPDVEALLADYLVRDNAAATQAQELENVVHRASEAVRRPAVTIELPSQIHRLMWRHRAEQVFALAASFVVGVGITALALRATFRPGNVASSHTPANAGPAVVTAARLATVESRIESLPFWSNQRAYLLASVAGPSSPKTRAN